MSADLPRAELVPARRLAWAWVVPLAAVLLAVWLARAEWASRGPRITVRFVEGHGIKAGDTLRHLGITVGQVTDVELSPELDAVICRVQLTDGAAGLARAGTRFWIVRPTVSLEGVGGLETIVGARYLAALPGPSDGEPQDEFIGLETPPLAERVEPGGLEIVLNAARRFGLLPGAPIYYRQIQIGSVVGVALSSDAASVEVTAYVRPAYVPLVRANSRFWQVTGIDMKLALTEGFTLRFESLRTLISGGIAMATPDDPGAAVTTGHGFLLRDTYEDEWLEWRPAIPVGSSLLPEGSTMPEPQRAVLRWREGRFLKTDEERQGNVLVLDRGLLGPGDMLGTPEGALVEEGVRLEVAGRGLDVDAEVLAEGGGLAVVDRTLPGLAAWPAGAIRALGEPEDCLVVADGLAPQALAAARLEPAGPGWQVEKRLTFEPRWHGACVLARDDGKLVGLLLLERGRARVASVLPVVQADAAPR